MDSNTICNSPAAVVSDLRCVGGVGGDVVDKVKQGVKVDTDC